MRKQVGEGTGHDIHGTIRTASRGAFQDKSNLMMWSDPARMKEASDRLRQLRIRKGFASPTEAARAFGWNEHTYKSHENGIRGIKVDAARKYAAAYGSTAGYILTGVNAGDQQIINQVAIAPLVGTVSAGVFRDDEGLFQESIAVPTVLRKGVPAEAQYAVLVDGPSVNLRIPDGMYAICARFDSFPGGAQHGQLVHVVRERAGLHEHTIKELRFTRGGMELHPTSNDPRFQEIVQLDDGDDPLVRIQGIVIGQYRPM